MLALLRTSTGRVTSPYRSLATLPIDTILSLHPDAALERSLTEASPPYRSLVVDDRDVLTQLGPGTRELLLVGGSVLRGTGIVTSQLEYESLLARVRLTLRAVQDRLAMSALLLLNCDTADWRIHELLSALTRHRTRHDGAVYACGGTISEHILAKYSPIVLPQTVDSLLSEILNQVGLRQPHRQTIHYAPQVISCAPYKYLDYFTADDTALFHGRSSDVVNLIATIRSSPSRITILCGRSGTGKTSLLRCGISSELYRVGEMTPIYMRCGRDPLVELTIALEQCNKLEAQHRPHLLIIDQMEEGFIKCGHETMAEVFTRLRVALVPETGMRLLISIRHDFLFHLSERVRPFVGSLRDVYLLSDLTVEAARTAFVQPAMQAGYQVQPAVVQAILEDLGSDTIFPPHLQIVFRAVCDACSMSKELKLDDYIQLGRASRILREHLDGALRAADSQASDQLQRILTAAVTSSRTRDLLTIDELSKRTNIPIADLTPCLMHLVHDARLMREVEGAGSRYELSHESLTDGIVQWMDSKSAHMRALQDILDQETATARIQPGHLLSDDTLELLAGRISELYLDSNAQMLVAATYAAQGQLPTAWQERAGDWTRLDRMEALLFRPARSHPERFEAILQSPVALLLEPMPLDALPADMVRAVYSICELANSSSITHVVRLFELDNHAVTILWKKFQVAGLSDWYDLCRKADGSNLGFMSQVVVKALLEKPQLNTLRTLVRIGIDSPVQEHVARAFETEYRKLEQTAHNNYVLLTEFILEEISEHLQSTLNYEFLRSLIRVEDILNCCFWGTVGDLNRILRIAGSLFEPVEFLSCANEFTFPRTMNQPRHVEFTLWLLDYIGGLTAVNKRVHAVFIEALEPHKATSDRCAVLLLEDELRRGYAVDIVGALSSKGGCRKVILRHIWDHAELDRIKYLEPLLNQIANSSDLQCRVLAIGILARRGELSGTAHLLNLMARRQYKKLTESDRAICRYTITQSVTNWPKDQLARATSMKETGRIVAIALASSAPTRLVEDFDVLRNCLRQTEGMHRGEIAAVRSAIRRARPAADKLLQAVMAAGPSFVRKEIQTILNSDE